ncbi:hypothetical protein KPH14_010330 [Odynerus spinipes]|uniref:Uncharacterized protein n=1 Tax=Odynerus spinipes TaxID=1348599 RepID=A0AAD9RTL7_9HYME|nr:hypothetical protein KPH14_010330 [Odynerus spinipes]
MSKLSGGDSEGTNDPLLDRLVSTTRDGGKTTQHLGGTSQAETDEKEIVASPLLPKQPAPVGFVYPTSQQLADNPYATQPAYNPSYVPPTYNSPDQPCDIVEHKKSTADSENDAENVNDDTTEKDDNCVTYCFIAIVAAIVVSIIVLIIYLSIKHPKIAKVVHEILKEVYQDETKYDSGIAKVLDPVITKPWSKIINKNIGMTTTTSTTLSERKDFEWEDIPDLED